MTPRAGCGWARRVARRRASAFPAHTSPPSLAASLARRRAGMTRRLRARLDERLVDEHRELHRDVAPVGQHLDHEDEHEVLLGVDLVCAAVCAAPAEGTDRFDPSVGAGLLENAKPETEALAGLGEGRSRRIRRHERYGLRSEKARAVERATVEQHLKKARVVAGRREQTGAAGEAASWTVDVIALPARAIRRARDAHVGATRVHGGEPCLPVWRQIEVGVLHAERAGDARANDFVQRRAGDAFDDTAEDVGVVAIDEALTRLGNER